MSFSGQAKHEMNEQVLHNICCLEAGCYGVACFAKSFGLNGLVLRSEREFVARWAKSLFAQAGVQGEIHRYGEESGNYHFVVDNPYEVEKLLAMLGHTGDEPALRIHEENISCGGCFSAFVSAAFLVAGTVVDPAKSYNMEFVSSRTQMLQDFAAVMRQKGFVPGLAKRKGLNVLYFRSSEQIEDLLTLMGAPGCTLEVMNRKVFRDVRNRVNRITNCETANIDKTVEANRKTLQAIGVLERAGKIESLPDELRLAATLRQKYPDLSLMELLALFPEPMSKASLARRFARIRQKAKSDSTERDRVDG